MESKPAMTPAPREDAGDVNSHGLSNPERSSGIETLKLRLEIERIVGKVDLSRKSLPRRGKESPL